MKKGYFVIAVIVALSFAAAAVMIPMMPEKIPAHYNAAGEVNRMGSRYEMLLFPGFTAVMGVMMSLLARSRKTDSEKMALIVTGVVSTALFTVLGIFFSIKAISYDPAVTNAADANRFTAVCLGLALIIMGNYMPKVGMNGMFGVRTPWSRKDAETWRKSQRFGGITAVVCGFVMLLSAIFVSGIAVVVVTLALVLVWAVACTCMSYKYSKN